MVQLEFCNNIKQFTISTDNIFDQFCKPNKDITELCNKFQLNPKTFIFSTKISTTSLGDQKKKR